MPPMFCTHLPTSSPSMAASVTPALNPLAGLMVTVDVPIDPTMAVAAVALIVKVGAAFTVNEIVVLTDNAPLVPFTVSV